MRERLKELGIHILAILLTTGLALSVLFGFVAIRDSVNAAPPATSDNCEKVATVNLIEVYYCEPDIGQPFKINTMGFMLNEE